MHKLEQDRLKQEEELREQGYDPDPIRRAVKSDPDIQKLMQQNETLQQKIAQQEYAQALTTDYQALLKELKDLGTRTFRIEAQHYTPKQVEEVVNLYRQAIDNIESFKCSEEVLNKLTEITNRGQSLQALNY
jgi:collagenase-like PrtC family protease